MLNKLVRVAVLFACICLSAQAADGPVPPGNAAAPTTSLLDEFSRLMAQTRGGAGRDTVPPDGNVQTSEVIRDSGLQAELEKAVLQYQIGSMEQRHRALEWQHYSGIAIFVVVVVVVLCGLVFSGLQFRASLRQVPTGPRISESDPLIAGTRTDVEFSAKGIRVSSPVIGILILTISLVFFYLYLVHVYPINEISSVVPR